MQGTEEPITLLLFQPLIKLMIVENRLNSMFSSRLFKEYIMIAANNIFNIREVLTLWIGNGIMKFTQHTILEFLLLLLTKLSFDISRMEKSTA